MKTPATGPSSARFRQAVQAIAATPGGQDAGELASRLVAALAMLAQAIGKEPSEADWWRILDALLLIAAHPALS